jgi:C-terminal processing protease CtpA/Prc
MASGGADARKLSDGSMLWLTARAIEDTDGRSYEGEGVAPDVAVPDREDLVIEAAIKALAGNRTIGGR